jgi:tRNA 5-methylaminomethyl-2-thiouridine biosynthesis bifunctional protein
MTASLIPAQLALRHDGTPYSLQFDDIYRSAAGAVDETRHVFLEGNRLPGRWSRRRSFTIVETGFGAGLNFLVTWLTWRRDPLRCARLHFVSVEKHPPRVDDLRRVIAQMVQQQAVHREEHGDTGENLTQVDTDLATLGDALIAAWPPLIAGMHRLEFDGGCVVLTLAFGDAALLCPKLALRADAFYLDGFTPAKNPELWTPGIFKALAKIADDGATFATYTSCGTVKAALTEAGFVHRKVAGFGWKRAMLTGEFAPPYRVRRHEPPARTDWPSRSAMIIGGGVAGCAVVERLAARGWAVTLLERRAAPAQEASGNPAAVFHPMIARRDTPAARLARAGFVYALQRWRALETQGFAPLWQSRGLLQVASDDQSFDGFAQALAHASYPSEFARMVSRDEATSLAGVEVRRGGVWFARGGVIDPVSLCDALLRAAGGALATLLNATVDTLVRRDGLWHALDAQGRTLACAPVAVVANAHDAARLCGLSFAPTRSARGQLTWLEPDPSAYATLHVPIVGDGYVARFGGSRCAAGVLTGATYEMDDFDLSERITGHAENLQRLGELVPSLAGRFDASSMRGRVGLRCVTSDRLPLAGALADEPAIRERAAAFKSAQLRDLPRATHLYGAFAYGSRGLIWASLCAELIAAQIEGEPWPVERDLADALDPARYLLRALRHGEFPR